MQFYQVLHLPKVLQRREMYLTQIQRKVNPKHKTILVTRIIINKHQQNLPQTHNHFKLLIHQNKLKKHQLLKQKLHNNNRNQLKLLNNPKHLKHHNNPKNLKHHNNPKNLHQHNNHKNNLNLKPL